MRDAVDLAAMAAQDSRTRGDAILFYADGYKFPDVYHVTRFLAPDPIIALEQDGEVVIVASPLEEGRARKESRAREVFSFDAFGAKEIGETAETREELDAEIIKRFLASRGTRRVAVGTYFPLGMAERLRGAGIEIVVDRALSERRRAKRPDEIAALEATQRATEDAWAKGVEALERATVRKDGTLELDGEPFTAERLRAIVGEGQQERSIYRHVNSGSQPARLVAVERNWVHAVGVDRQAGFEELQPCPEYRQRQGS